MNVDTNLMYPENSSAIHEIRKIIFSALNTRMNTFLFVLSQCLQTFCNHWNADRIGILFCFLLLFFMFQKNLNEINSFTFCCTNMFEETRILELKKHSSGTTHSAGGTANASQDTCDGDSVDSGCALMPVNAPSARHLARRKVIFHKASDAALSLSLVVVPPEGLSGNKEKSSLFKKFRNKLKRDGSAHVDSEREDSRDSESLFKCV